MLPAAPVTATRRGALAIVSPPSNRDQGLDRAVRDPTPVFMNVVIIVFQRGESARVLRAMECPLCGAALAAEEYPCQKDQQNRHANQRQDVYRVGGTADEHHVLQIADRIGDGQ